VLRLGIGSFGNLSSAAVVAASSFSMSLVDPSPFLEKVNKIFYGALVRKDAVSKQTDAVVYVEPRMPKNYSIQPSLKPEARTNREMSGNDKWIITSRIQTLGDSIDTDAVSIHIFPNSPSHSLTCNSSHQPNTSSNAIQTKP